MKFKELPHYLAHELKSRRFNNMRVSITPFLDLALKWKAVEIYAVLEGILKALDNNSIVELEFGISQLTDELKLSDLSEMGTSSFNKKVEVFGKNKHCFAVMLDNDFIRSMFVKLLKKRYGLVRNYSSCFTVENIMGKQALNILCDYKNYLLLEKLILSPRIVYVDYPDAPEIDFISRKLILPARLREVDTIFDAYCEKI